MVFGNQLIDFAALDDGSKSTPSKVGKRNKYVEVIDVSSSGLTFRVTWNQPSKGNYAGCGPQDIFGEDVDFGICVAYPETMSEADIKRKLTKIITDGVKQLPIEKQKALREQEKYQKAKIEWDRVAMECRNRGVGWDMFNKDTDSTSGQITDNWVCLEDKPSDEDDEVGVASVVDTETNEEEEEEDDDVVSPTLPVRSSTGSSVEVGLGQGFTDTMKTGIKVLVVGGIGYGAYKLEDRTSIFSNLFSKLMPKDKTKTSGSVNSARTTSKRKTIN